MATLKVNTEQYIRGRMSISREKADNGMIVTYGVLETHDYIENIHTIESERYLVTDVEIRKESFGTNDYNIAYSFTASDIIIKDDYIPDEVKMVIEYNLYKDEFEEYFHSINFNEALELYNELFNNNND